MDTKSIIHERLNNEDLIKIYLAEYDAIERLHIHYDTLNMNMTAFITAGIITVWGIVIQAAFQADSLIYNSTFVNIVSVLALVLFAILSIWIRYLTIHRCIVIQKLIRSHKIEKAFGITQNSIFILNPANLYGDINSDFVRRRPGGHTLELFLYFMLSTFGGTIAFLFQLHLRTRFTYKSFMLIGLLIICLILAILWMSFCKLDAVKHMEQEGPVPVGLPWNYLFIVVKPINSFLRWFINFNKREF
jgi:hypothetical protein